MYVIACCVSIRTHLLRLRNEYTWRGGETSTSISNAMLLKKYKTKSSTDKHSTAIIVHEAKRTATSTRTTHTRQNKPFEAAAVQQRRCPQLLSSLAVSAAVRTWCGGETSTRKTSTSISNAMLLKKKKEIINRKADHCHHRPRSKAHSNEYENNKHKGQQALRSRCCPAATVPDPTMVACDTSPL